VPRGTTDSPPEAFTWVVQPAGTAAAGDAVTSGTAVALRHTSPATTYLDAAAGSDGPYTPGDGLTGLVAGPVAHAQWDLKLVHDRLNKELVNGDYVVLRSHWQGPNGDKGFLLGETDRSDPRQRVCSFGGQNQVGTVWRINKLAATTT